MGRLRYFPKDTIRPAMGMLAFIFAFTLVPSLAVAESSGTSPVCQQTRRDYPTFSLLLLRQLSLSSKERHIHFAKMAYPYGLEHRGRWTRRSLLSKGPCQALLYVGGKSDGCFAQFSPYGILADFVRCVCTRVPPMCTHLLAVSTVFLHLMLLNVDLFEEQCRCTVPR